MHDVRFIDSAAKVSKFFIMQNKLGKKINIFCLGSEALAEPSVAIIQRMDLWAR